MDKNNPNNLTPEQIKAGYSTVAGAYDPVTGKLKTATRDAVTSIPTQPTAITPQSIQQVTPINVPQPALSVAPTVPVTNNIADSYLKDIALTENEKAAQTGEGDLISKMLQNITNQQGESTYRSELLQGSGLGTLKQDLQSLNSQILKKQAEVAQNDIQLVANMRAEERRDTLLPFAQMGQAKLAGDAAIMRALKTSEIGVLNALAIGKQGDIALAKETINEAVDAKFAPYKEQNALYEAQLKAIQPFLTSAEKKQANAQQFKLNQAVKEIDKVSDFQKTILSNALSSGASQSVINGILNGKTREEITKAGAGYLRSKADILDEKLKNEQILTSQASRSKIYADIAKDKATANGGINQETITKAIESKTGQKVISTKNLIDQMSTLNNLYTKYGARPTDATALGEVQSARAAAQLAIAEAFGQGAIQEGDRKQYESMIGTSFGIAPTARLNQAIKTQEANYTNQLNTLDTAYPGIKTLNTFSGSNNLNSYLDTVDKVSSSGQSKVTDYLSSLPKIGNK